MKLFKIYKHISKEKGKVTQSCWLFAIPWTAARQAALSIINSHTLHSSHTLITTATAKLLQSCPTLCNPIPGILQARTLEWVAISFSNAWKWEVKVKSLSHVWLFATSWTAAHQAPPSMGFSRKEHGSGLPLPSPMLKSEKWKWGRSVMSDSSRPHGLQPTRLLLPWDDPGKSTGVGCHCLLRHTSKVMHKILQARLQQYVNCELPDVQAGFRKGKGTRNQIANTHWVIEKAREFQKNIYFCFIDYAKAFGWVDHNKLWKFLKELGIPDHLTCLLRNLYAGQEATVRAGHGTTVWSQIGKGVC